MLFTEQSNNEKTGPIPVSTSSKDTCPPSCPFYDKGCYAMYGPLGMLWSAMTAAGPDTTFKGGRGQITTFGWDSFLDRVEALPEGTLWRHNQAGDLPGDGDKVDGLALRELVRANKGKKGFTYSHKPMDVGDNANWITYANMNGFTVNLSANNLAEADTLVNDYDLPTVVVLPSTIHGNVKIETPAGRRVVVCPATYRDDITCKSCGLCAIRNRNCIVGFPGHGAAKKHVDNLVSV